MNIFQDGFETGTWTVLFGNGTFGSGGMGTTQVNATYIKIGRIVHIQFEAIVNHTANTNGSGFLIRGLPYDVDPSHVGGSGTIYNTTSSGAAVPAAQFNGMGTWFIQDGPWTQAGANPSGTSGTSTWRGFATYITAQV